MDEKRKCTRCSVTLPITDFTLKRNGEYTKQCNFCNEKQRKFRDNNKCEHGKEKCKCKDCKGSCICEHDRRRSECKDCKGASICEHDRKKSICKDCKGASICEHGKRRSICKDCKGGSICEHNRERSKCKDCGGGSVCEHDRIKSQCKDCKGASICEHGKRRNICKDCEGTSICEHSRERSKCKICDPFGHLTSIVRSHVSHALKNNKQSSSIEYLGATIQEYRSYIEEQFEEGMTWNNYGEWHIDHIVPLKYKDEEGNLPDLEELMERLHFSNTQPLWASENIAKGNRYIG